MRTHYDLKDIKLGDALTYTMCILKLSKENEYDRFFLQDTFQKFVKCLMIHFL